MSITTEDILNKANKKGKIRTSDFLSFGVSRQYISKLIAQLVRSESLIKIGSTRKAAYALPEYASRHMDIFPMRIAKDFINKGLEEHKVLDGIENKLPAILNLPENVRAIFTFAFSEMLNNAIEHSRSKKIHIEVSIKSGLLTFRVSDHGIGAFRNIMRKRKLRSEPEAIQDLLKGKTTTMPKSHSGEGIFFTSRSGEEFILNSFGYQLVVDNKAKDVFIQKPKKSKRGTEVIFKLRTDSDLHLTDVFKEYTNIGENSDHGFDKTEVKIRLYTVGGVYVSRSQARRILHGLEKFKVIVFDFDQVPMVGQAFADEIFRVFHNKYPDIKIDTINMNEGIKFMVDRVEGNNPRFPRLFDNLSK